MLKYGIYAGLEVAELVDTVVCENKTQALAVARDCAIEEYENKYGVPAYNERLQRYEDIEDCIIYYVEQIDE